MLQIIKLKGRQRTQDLSFIQDDGSRRYYTKLEDSAQISRKSLLELFPSTSPALVDLLRQMLEFNPHFRPTAKECLSLPLFDSIRMPNLEMPASFKINFDIDNDEDMQLDYEYLAEHCDSVDHKAQLNILKKIVLDEINRFK